ncbi:MAG TPA: hypothetical protein VEH27_02315 [Methylomirabilota bacterium]|nr:hypothetical protein [Methylomirabilota bacterium]
MTQLIAKNGFTGEQTPTVHMEFIQHQVGRPEAEGLEAVESYHRALFLHQNGAELERCQQQARIHQERLSHLESRLQAMNGRLVAVDKVIPAEVNGQADTQPTMPWNAWDVAMFIAAGLGVVVLLAFGVLNISFNLLESGLVTFTESPFRAYFWAALLPVGALAVKVGWDLLESTKARRVYLWSSLVIGLGGVIVWLAAYSVVYPTLSRSISEQIQTLSVFDAAADSALGSGSGPAAKWIDVITVASQAIAEIFLSAVLGIHMTMLYLKHRPVRLASNPLFTQLEEERRSLEQTVAEERMSLAAAKGAESRLLHQLEALIAYAKSLFQKESALLKDQAHQRQTLLNQLSETLRTQLDTISNGAARNHTLTEKESAQ